MALGSTQAPANIAPPVVGGLLLRNCPPLSRVDGMLACVLPVDHLDMGALFLQDPETGLFYPASGKPSPQLPSSAGSAAAIVAVGQNGVGMYRSTVGDCLSCLREARSAELEALPSMSTAGGSMGAQSAPLWLPHYQQALQQYPSGCSLPQQPSAGATSDKLQPSGRTSMEGGGASSDSTPCLSAKEQSVLQLSDWEIRPEGACCCHLQLRMVKLACCSALISNQAPRKHPFPS